MNKRPNVQSQAGPNKKVKLDELNPAHLAKTESYDPLEEDIGVGAARKKDVKLDGYASDSSEEGHGIKRVTDLSNEAGPVDDDDDMFGQAPSKDASHTAKDADKKQPRFLDIGEIQGQDFKSRSEFMDIVDDDAEDEEDDEEIDEEVGALGKKKNAPKLDSFNMREELEEGKFDEDGNYIRTAKDQKDNQDDWLQDVSRKDIQAAKEAVERRQREEMERDAVVDSVTLAELLTELIRFLDKGETLLEALQRSSGPSKRPKRRKDRKSKGKDPEVDNSSSIKRITEVANQLMAKTELDIYDTEREGLIRAFKKETGEEFLETRSRDTDEIMLDNDQQDTWEFVWQGKEDVINGPYPTTTMLSWYDGGLLGSTTSIALVRRVGSDSFVPVSRKVLQK